MNILLLDTHCLVVLGLRGPTLFVEFNVGLVCDTVYEFPIAFSGQCLSDTVINYYY